MPVTNDQKEAMTVETIPTQRQKEDMHIPIVREGAHPTDAPPQPEQNEAALGSLVLETANPDEASPYHSHTTLEAPAVAAEPTETAYSQAIPDQENTADSPHTMEDQAPNPEETAWEVWELVQRAQAGDGEAFAEIYDRYNETVFRFIYFRTQNRQLAEDLTSDTWLKAIKRIGSFTWQGKDLGAWLITIARNLTADHRKSGRNRLELLTEDPHDGARHPQDDSPEDQVITLLTNADLMKAVQQLIPAQRRCIELRCLKGLSVAETAQKMGKNEGAIKALQYRAVGALRRLLPEDFEPF